MRWHGIFGDRKNKIVFIGRDMNKEGITADLEARLATEQGLES
ncbi:GTP-binding protein [Ulvibacterium sp.]